MRQDHRNIFPITSTDIFYVLIHSWVEEEDELPQDSLIEKDPKEQFYFPFTENAKKVAAIALSDDYKPGNPVFDAVVAAASRLMDFECKNGVNAAYDAGFVDEEEVE